MKRVVLSLLMFGMIFARTPGWALNVDSNGYDWNSSDVSERAAFCKVVARIIGRDYLWWMRFYGAVYDTRDPFVLKMTLQQAGTGGAIIGEQWIQDKFGRPPPLKPHNRRSK